MISAKTRKWGNSIGVRIPKSYAEELNLKEGQDIFIDIEPPAKD